MRDVGNQLHTTHKSSTGRIYYRFHPDFGTEVTILFRYRPIAGNNVRIRLPEGCEVGIPEWMLDEQACLNLFEVDRPVISIRALTHLGRLLDAQPIVRGSQTGVGRAILPSNDTSEQGKTTTTVRAGRSGSRASSRRERALQRAPESDAARSAPEGSIDRKRGRNK